MRRLIVTPWDIASVNQVVALQNEHDFFLMNLEEEKAYWDEFKPKDWFFARDKQGNVVGFVRHFPHFSTKSWVQLVLEPTVANEDLTFLLEHFFRAAFLEEADGFRLHIKLRNKNDKEGLSNVFKNFDLRFSETRTWNFVPDSQFVEPGSQFIKGWSQPDGFKAAMMLMSGDDFLDSQVFTPFNERIGLWCCEQSGSVLRFEQRGRNLFLLENRCATVGERNFGIQSLLRKLGVNGIWISSDDLHSQKRLFEAIYTKD